MTVCLSIFRVVDLFVHIFSCGPPEWRAPTSARGRRHGRPARFGVTQGRPLQQIHPCFLVAEITLGGRGAMTKTRKKEKEERKNKEIWTR